MWENVKVAVAGWKHGQKYTESFQSQTSMWGVQNTSYKTWPQTLLFTQAWSLLPKLQLSLLKAAMETIFSVSLLELLNRPLRGGSAYICWLWGNCNNWRERENDKQHLKKKNVGKGPTTGLRICFSALCLRCNICGLTYISHVVEDR